ncbi:hypothetical protein A2U01_0049962, partial [Trifolium medium]|nr:hypothetical protein [Trifolium medium]
SISSAVEHGPITEHSKVPKSNSTGDASGNRNVRHWNDGHVLPIMALQPFFDSH